MMKPLMLVVLVLVIVTVFAITRRDTMFGTVRAVDKGYRDITASMLVDTVAKDPGVLLVDVREPDEYVAGHIKGVTLIPLGTLAGRLKELPKDKDIVLICRSGNRSSQAAAFLVKQGYTRLINLVGGMGAWTGPVEKGMPK